MESQLFADVPQEDESVPLQLWWSDADKIVIDQAHQSGVFYRELRKRRPRARVEAVTGSWSHSFKTYANMQSCREQCNGLALCRYKAARRPVGGRNHLDAPGPLRGRLIARSQLNPRPRY
jgi:hypothetical protein